MLMATLRGMPGRSISGVTERRLLGGGGRRGNGERVSLARPLFVHHDLVRADVDAAAADVFGDLVAHLLESLRRCLQRLAGVEKGDEKPVVVLTVQNERTEQPVGQVHRSVSHALLVDLAKLGDVSAFERCDSCEHPWGSLRRCRVEHLPSCCARSSVGSAVG